MMLTEKIECRAVKYEMLFIPNMERAMPAEPLLTWGVLMPPLHDGRERERVYHPHRATIILYANLGPVRWS